MTAKPDDSSAPMNYVFVDFENVPKIDFAVIGSPGVTLILLLGARHLKLDVSLVEKMMAHASSVQIVRLTANGKNALDFALAFHLGKTAASHPTGHFHIVSKDKGFDPLVEHLQRHYPLVRRHEEFSTLPFAATARARPAQAGDLLGRVREDLRMNKNNRPKKKSALLSRIKGFAGKEAADSEVADVFQKLQAAGEISIDAKDTVTYRL